MKRPLALLIAIGLLAVVASPVPALEQAEAEFQQLMPLTGKVETSFGDFQLDHSFPAAGEGDKLHDLIDRQRAAQLYLWGVPLVGMTRWHEAYRQNYGNYDYNTLVSVTRFNERRGILTANETTDYLFGASNTREAAVVLEVPPGLFVGMVVDMWQQSPSDVGVFGPNAGNGGTHVILGPSTPADMIPEPADGQRFHRIDTDRVFFVWS